MTHRLASLTSATTHTTISKRGPIAAFIFTVLLVLGLLDTESRADIAYRLTTDTSSLAGKSGEFSIDFQFSSGSGNPDNNSVTLSDFTFGGGTALPATTTTIGDATGDLSNPPITIGLGQVFGELTEDFVPGSSFAFTVQLTTNVEPAADTFAYAILFNGANIATTNPNGSLLEIDLTSVPTVVASPSTDPSFPIDAPTVSSVPEPSTLILALTGMAILGYRARKCLHESKRQAPAGGRALGRPRL
jgi:hypothetical protein